jgi:hypothetical protein
MAATSPISTNFAGAATCRRISSVLANSELCGPLLALFGILEQQTEVDRRSTIWP